MEIASSTTNATQQPTEIFFALICWIDRQITEKYLMFDDEIKSKNNLKTKLNRINI